MVRGMTRKRIISLLPACTEIVCALGCAEQLVGRSHECDFPPEILSVPVCTSTKANPAASSAAIDHEIKSLASSGQSVYELDAQKIQELRPDIILTQGQCEVCAVSLQDLERALPSRRPQIVALSPARLADVWTGIQTVADALGCAVEGRELLSRLKNQVVDIIQKTCMVKKRPGVACIEWIEPLMAAGNWIPEMVELAGGRNLFGEAGRHSPWLDEEKFREANPDIVILMPCGFSLERTRMEAEALKLPVKPKNVFITDGNQFFNRPGPRLVESMEILAEIIHPEIFSFGHEGRGWAREVA
jgi:iron complex transport system substrate-binding protein